MTLGEERKALLRGNANCPPKEKRVMIAGEPVLPFDNQSTNLSPTIELLTIRELAELLKISVSGARRLQQARCIPFIKIGGSVRFLKSDVASYIEKQRVGAIDI